MRQESLSIACQGRDELHDLDFDVLQVWTNIRERHLTRQCEDRQAANEFLTRVMDNYTATQGSPVAYLSPGGIMPTKVLACNLVLRQWGQTGLIETSKTFSSLDELYAHCLTTGDAEMVDRIVIRGRNKDGQMCELSFVFQSITVAPAPKA